MVSKFSLLCVRSYWGINTEDSLLSFRCDVVGQFMEYVARSSVIAEVPAARVAYLGVLTSLASGPQGAQVVAFHRPS